MTIRLLFADSLPNGMSLVNVLVGYEMQKWQSMCEEHGVLFAFWDGKSRGTKNMNNMANRYGLEVHVVNY